MNSLRARSSILKLADLLRTNSLVNVTLDMSTIAKEKMDQVFGIQHPHEKYSHVNSSHGSSRFSSLMTKLAFEEQQHV